MTSTNPPMPALLLLTCSLCGELIDTQGYWVQQREAHEGHSDLISNYHQDCSDQYQEAFTDDPPPGTWAQL